MFIVPLIAFSVAALPMLVQLARSRKEAWKPLQDMSRYHFADVGTNYLDRIIKRNIPQGRLAHVVRTCPRPLPVRNF